MPNWKTYDSSVRLLSAILAAHPELRLNYQEISKCFGGDCTTSALENRFRRIKTDAKNIKECLAKGIDPITLPVEGGRIGDATAAAGGKKIAKYYGECTESSLDHRFRPIKKAAQEMRQAYVNGGGIADKYGEDVTAKAVSTRFERLKKEPHWLGNESMKGDANGNAANAKTNGAAKGTPRKTASPKKKFGDDEVSGDDDEELDDKTPLSYKKTPLNKTSSGRVQKTRTPKKNVSYMDLDNGDEGIIKQETHMSFDVDGLENNGHNYGFQAYMEDVFQESQGEGDVA